MVLLRPTLAFVNGTRVTEEDVSEAQLWAEGRAVAMSASQDPVSLREHPKEAPKRGEQRPSLTPSSINFEDVWSGGAPQVCAHLQVVRSWEVLSKQ